MEFNLEQSGMLMDEKVVKANKKYGAYLSDEFGFAMIKFDTIEQLLNFVKTIDSQFVEISFDKYGVNDGFTITIHDELDEV